MLFKTDFNGYAVKFSPFEDGRLAVATSQNFGIIGNGRQYVLQVQSQVLLAPPSVSMHVSHLGYCNAGYTTRPGTGRYV